MIHILKPGFVDKVTKPGMYRDGGALFLQVKVKGNNISKSWILRYRFKGKPRYMGLGPYPTVSPKEARGKAEYWQNKLREGFDPIEQHKREKEAKEAEAAKEVIFDTAAEDYIALKRKTRFPGTAKNAAYAHRNYLKPKLGNKPVSKITVNDVYEMLKPIWDRVPVTGDFVRAHCEHILGRARAKGRWPWPDGDNPASKALLIESGLLPAVHEVHTTKHRPALPYEDIGKFMAELRAYKSPNLAHGISVPGALLEFLILTAARTDEARRMEWGEIRWEDLIWDCPWQRMKRSKRKGSNKNRIKVNQLVPLSDDALAILRRLQTKQSELGVQTVYVFAHLPPTTKWLGDLARNGAIPDHAGHVINQHAARQFLKDQLGRPEITVHGFRTAFSSWAYEMDFPPRDIEMALDHVPSSSSEGDDSGRKRDTPVALLYARQAKRLEPRRKLMDAWAERCNQIEPPTAEVVPLKRKAANV